MQPMQQAPQPGGGLLSPQPQRPAPQRPAPQRPAPQQTPVAQGVQQEMNGVKQADSGQQGIYNVFVKMGAVIAGNAKDSISKRLNTGDKTTAMAQATVMVIEQAIEQLGQMGVEVPDEIILEGGKEIMGAIYTMAGIEMSPEERQITAEKAVDTYLSHQEQTGTIDNDAINEIAQMIQRGELPAAGGELPAGGGEPLPIPPQQPQGGGLL